MKKILLALFLTTAVHAVATPAVLQEDAKLELTKGKGSVVLKAGTVVEVVGQEGDSIAVIFRSMQGRLLANKTDYVGGPVKPVPEKSKPDAKIDASAAPAKPAAVAKPAEVNPASSAASAPSSIQGKMVKKARENEAKHKENLVEPTDAVTTGGKK